MAKPNPRIEAAKARIARFNETGIFELGDDVKLVGTSLKGKITCVGDTACVVKVPNFGEMVRAYDRLEFVPPYTGFYRKPKKQEEGVPLPSTSDGFPVVFQRKDSRQWPVTRSR